MTLSDLYKLPDLDKRADSGAVSVYIYPASGQRAIQLVQSVSEARCALTVTHTGWQGINGRRRYYLQVSSNIDIGQHIIMSLSLPD